MSSRDRILARRAKFIAAAIASAGAISCSDDASTTTPQVCLEPAIDAATADTGKDTGPMPCLDPVVDTGVADSASDSAVTDTGDIHDTAPEPDTGPMPCLKMPPPDGG